MKNTIILAPLVSKKYMSKVAFFTAHSYRYASFDFVFDIEKYCSFHVNISWYTNALFVKQRLGFLHYIYLHDNFYTQSKRSVKIWFIDHHWII